MKKYIFILLTTVFALTSCDDILNVTPRSQMAPEDFFQTEAEMQAWTNTFYTAFPSSGLYNEQVDNIIGQSLSSEVRGTRVVPASGGGWSWGTLRNINTLLDYQNNCKDEAVRTRYVALARFFRCYFYYNMVARFGDVPWYDTQLESDSEQLKRPRDSREFIMQKMLEDIDFAIANLPSERSLYTITRWTALALKSRFTLFEGTFRKYHNLNGYEHDWRYYLTLCAEASNEFISKSGYGTYTTGGTGASYRNLFIHANQATNEVILGRNYSSTLKVFHGSHWYLMSTSMGRPGVTKRIIDSYLMKDGTRFTSQSGWATKTFVQEVVNRDPRLSQSIRTPGYKREGSNTQLPPDMTCTATGYQLTKYVGKSDGDGADKSYTDLIIFRSAEVYLNFAEAKAELGTLTQADITASIKKLRDRVGMPTLDMAAANGNPDPYLQAAATGYPNVTGANAGVILEIRRERSIELLMEGFRYNDMMRWKEGKTFEQPLYGMYFPAPGDYDLDGDGTFDVCLYTGTFPTSTASVLLKIGTDVWLSGGSKGYLYPGKTVTCIWNEDKDYLYPIPTEERSLTGGALTQNPGWNDGLSF